MLLRAESRLGTNDDAYGDGRKARDPATRVIIVHRHVAIRCRPGHRQRSSVGTRRSRFSGRREVLCQGQTGRGDGGGIAARIARSQ